MKEHKYTSQDELILETYYTILGLEKLMNKKKAMLCELCGGGDSVILQRVEQARKNQTTKYKDLHKEILDECSKRG